MTFELTYCTECGHDKLRILGKTSRQCEYCYQELFTDVDYSDTIPKVLKRRYEDKIKLDDLKNELHRIKRENMQRISCPDNIKGCAVAHYKLNDIGIMVNQLINFLDKRGK